MPKAYDVKHNYYADLELPNTATVEEVKKQYRKLALLYHPDRNAGKEEEFIPKFQAIQAAHEILGDALQKNKYDADRRKAGLYPGLNSVGGGAPRGNPYQATSAYPPPPRRTQPGTWQRPGGPANTQPSGAERFTNFPRQTPTAKRTDPAADRQNTFRAWQNMNSAQERQNQPQAQHSRFGSAGAPGQSPATPRRPQVPPRQDTKFPSDEKIRAGFNYREAPSSSHTAERADERQSAWAAFQQAHAGKPGLARSNTNKTPKKQGFDPNAPGSDERPAPDSAYVHRHKSADFGRPSPVPPPPPGPPPSQPTTPISPTSKRPFADPLRPFKSRTSTDGDTPYSEGNRQRTPYSSFVGERTDFSGSMRRSNSTRDTTRQNTQANSTRARSTSPLGRHPKTRGHESQDHGHPNQQKPTFSVGGSSSSSAESSDPEVMHTPEQYQSPFVHPNKPKVAPQERPKKVPSPPSKRFNGSANAPFPPPTDGAASDSSDTKQKSSSNIFSFPISPDTFTTNINGKARSEENINTKFSADGWNGTFAGSSDYFAPPSATTQRNSPSARNGQRPGLRSATSNYPQSPSTMNMPPPPRPAGMDDSIPGTSGADGEVKFSKEQWENTFKDGSWTWPPPPPKPPASPAKSAAKSRGPSRKGSRTSAKSPAVGSGTAANPQVVDEDDEQTTNPQNFSGKTMGQQFSEPEPMDIDQAPPAVQQPGLQTAAKEPRMVSVPPSAWRQQQNGPAHRRNVSGPGSAFNAPLNTKLDDLAQVAPFTSRPTEAGLKDLSSLHGSLPFQSQAASTLPTHPLKPQTLQTPVVPVPPKAPTRLTKAEWHLFAQNFALYLRAFHSFNRTLIQHFNAREAQAQARMKNGLAWLEATGDTVNPTSPTGANGPGLGTEGMLTGPSGWGNYLQGVKEDERVREVWGVGCERHREAVKGFEEVRERVRKLVVGGGLM